MRKNICSVLLAVLLFSAGVPVYAGWGKLTVDTGGGDQMVIKHGLFGHKTMVQDRLGDGFATSRSILGTKSEEISVLGNSIRYHRGLLGLSTVSAHTLLGDSVDSHKGLLYRNTKVNLGGMNSLLDNYTHPQMPVQTPVAPGQGAYDPSQGLQPFQGIGPGPQGGNGNGNY